MGLIRHLVRATILLVPALLACSPLPFNWLPYQLLLYFSGVVVLFEAINKVLLH